MVKFLYRATLIIIFIAGIALLAVISLADYRFQGAKGLEKDYRWSKAKDSYQKAIILNPFNSKYFSKYGDFLFDKSKYYKNSEKELVRAQRAYQRAIKLNPRLSENWYKLGSVQITQALLIQEQPQDKMIDEDKNWEVIGDSGTKAYQNLSSAKRSALIDSAVYNFKKAINLEQYDIRNNYFIGYGLLKVWRFLEPQEKGFALKRFKQVLSKRLHYNRLIFPFLYYVTEDFDTLQKVTPDTFRAQKALYQFIKDNDLWQYRKEQKKILDSYAKKEEMHEFQEILDKKKDFIIKIKKEHEDKKIKKIEKKDWEGTTHNGKTSYKDGHMYWTGTINAPIYLPSGENTLLLEAKATPAEGIWAYMIVEVDGQVVYEDFITNTDWQQYSFKVKSDEGLKVVSVTFANDGGNEQEDRNLYVGEIWIE